ncbi:MAG: bifunctional hydroxymethylpyrimidine kinase/phosphomethylpyrimidine kinase, partial [Verrucomicrobium sp.]
MASSPPVVLTMAGSDCSGGAGVQADLKTFTALGCYGMTALTSVVAETPLIVDSIQLLDPAIIAAQIRVLALGFDIAAAKTGMLGGAAQIAAVLSEWPKLAEKGVPLVVDPVMVATSGGRLLERDAEEILISQLLPLARIITPNLDEAEVLLGSPLSSREDMVEGARTLASRHGVAVLLKGGHLVGSQTPDVLVEGEEIHWFEGERIPGVHTHGTGCTYSSAIAAGLGHGLTLAEAV